MQRASLAAIAFLFAACPAPERDTEGGTDAGPDDAVDAGPDVDAGVPDLGRDPSCPDDVAWVGEVTGSVVDESGAPVVGAIAQMCVRTHGGLFLCLQPTPSEPDGSFHFVVADNARCADRATLRVLVPQADRATLYCGVALSLIAPSLVLDEPFVMVATEAPTARPEIGDENAMRTVLFAGGLEIDVTPAALVFTEDYARLAARALSPSNVPACLIADAPAFDGLIAFSPESELSESSFAMRIPHGGALVEGASVALHLLGGLSTSLADGTRVEEGVWQQFGTGTVTGDVIDVPQAEGIPSFNWMGWRALP